MPRGLGNRTPGFPKLTNFVDQSSVFYDPTVEYGDRSANRISPIQAASFSSGGFDQVVIQFGGARRPSASSDRPGIIFSLSCYART